MKRRIFLRAAAAAGATTGLGAPAVFAQSAREKTLRVAPLTALSSVDTVFNTSLVTTNHGYAARNAPRRHPSSLCVRAPGEHV